MEAGTHRVGGIAGIEGLEFYHGDRIADALARTLHLGWELGMCSAGSARLVFEGGEELLTAGTLFLIPPCTVHSLESVSEHSFCTLRLSQALVTELLGSELTLPLVPIVEHPLEARETWCWLCGQLLDELPEAVHRSALVGGVRTIFRRLLKDHDAPTPLPERVEKMRSVLADGLADKVSLAELSASVGLSQFHAARLFKSSVGVSPHEYQILLRVERAKRLLLGGLTVSQVAGSVGFSDQSHLHRYFKRYVHVTPGEYRRWTSSESKKIQAEIGDRMGEFFREQRGCDAIDSNRASPKETA